MSEQELPLEEKRKLKGWVWGAVVGVLTLLAGGVWLAQMQLGVFSDMIVASGDKDAGVVSVDTKILKQFSLQVPSPNKAKILKLTFIPNMPETYGSMFAASKGTVLGQGGVGAGCGKPKRDLWNLRTEVPIYLTGEKLVGLLGKEEAERQLNTIIKMCVAWAEWAPIKNDDDFFIVTDELYITSSSTQMVKL